ncbi:ABC transporter permease [Desulfopila sp. IMCC35006]|uniref:ABC transporter permease n=1 Tax=Desulfopila sp. IMCC35006 TaxID=2569542 RepID=UPI0010ACFB52|nr:ABC transporter permease [Desulfopila sp. IMCC35006]TKB28584.1 ABC transporter permease [Desulfopila sp. IMCC35006]
MLQRLYRMLIKEFLQMLRDPRMRVVIFGMPVIQLTIMAFALTTDVTDIRLAVLDMDKTPASRELISAFTAGNYFRITDNLMSEREITPLLDRSDVRAVLQIPFGFSKDILTEQTAGVQLITDGTDSNSTSIALGYAGFIVSDYNDKRLAERLGRKGTTISPVQITTESRAWYNTNQESKFYYVPALIATMLYIFSLLLTSIGIVREKEIGTIEQVMVTPIRGIEFILGKTIPYMITGYITMSIMLIVAFFLFGVHVRGSLLLLYGLTGIYLAGNMGIALLISGSAATQQQALLTSFLILMPSVMLSGFMFPISNMPDPVRYATVINPMRWYLDILRGIVMKDVGISALWPAIVAQTVLSVTFLTLAISRFKKTLS